MFDTVGKETLDNSLAAIAQYGHIVTIQCRSSHDLSNLYLKSASLHAVFMLIPLIYNTQRERHGKILEKIAELADKKIIKPLLNPQQFSLENVGQAHALLESGKAVGKVVINIQ